MAGGVVAEARTSRANLHIRCDQKLAIERLADEHDLTQSQVARRLLDLGLAQWTTPDGIREAFEVAS